MGRIADSLSLVHQILKTSLAALFLAAAAGGMWWGYGVYAERRAAWERTQRELADLEASLKKQTEALDDAKKALASKTRQVESLLKEVGNLKETVARQAQRIERLQTAMRLLKVRRRVAQLRVIDRRKDDTTGEVLSRVEFVELDREGKPLEKAKQYTVTGDVIYVDSWVVKFEDRYVEQADLDRATSLVLFRRLFTDKLEPSQGLPLDRVGDRPQAYADGRPMSAFERAIWKDFWSVATDQARAKELGIRAAHGEAPSVPLIKGMVYRIELRASDGLSIRPETQPATGRAGGKAG